MSRWLMAVAVGLTLAGAGLAEEDEGRLTGKVTDEAGQALVGANVAVKGPQIPGGKGVSADGQGRYQIGDLHPGTYQVTATYVGHKAAAQEVQLAAGQALDLDFVLKSVLIELEQSVVSASRVQEKILDAPASVGVVEAPEIRGRPVLSVSEHVKSVPGVDISRTGLVQSNAVVRGFNNVFSGALMTLTDNRLAHVPSLRLNAYNFIPVVNDDIERIEVVLGPGSALYGPNSANGVMHIITRSPLNSQGTSVRLGGGERSLRQVELRHAGVIESKLGYKVSAQYYAGTDWKYTDPAETRPRDYDVQRRSLEARLDYRPTGDLTAIASFGHNLGSYIEMTGLGAAQAKDWSYNYGQLRLLYGNWFAQAFRNWSDAGDTYLLRSGADIVDKSSLTAFQLQHQASLGSRQRFIYGADALLTRPNSEGTITGQNEEDDDINELGGYLQSETALHAKLNLVLALRYDDHNRIGKAEWSPRAALVFKPRETQTLRLTYNRAFSTPTSNNLYLDLVSSPDAFGLGRNFAAALGYSPAIDVRAQGNYRKGYEGGFSFRRGADGRPLFRSPFSPVARLQPGDYLSLDDPVFTNVMWGVGRGAVLAQFAPVFQGLATQRLMAAGMDATTAQTQAGALAAGLPGLLPAQLPGLKNTLRELNPETRGFDPVTVADVVDVPSTKPTITRTYELGYKGLIGGKLVVAADAYRTQTKNFVGPLAVETPNVFLDPASLAAALGPALGAALQDPANAALAQALGALDANGNGPVDELVTQIALGVDGKPGGSPGVAEIPFGTVTPEQAYDPNAVILTYRNYGEVTVKGLDLSLAYYLGERWSFTGNYSWVDDNLFENLDNIADVTLNSPKQKFRVGVTRELPQWRLRAGAGVRHNGSYPMASGVYEGEVEAFTLLDLNLVYKLPVDQDLSLILNADNVLDKQHREFVGAPEIGRLVFAQLGVNF